MPWTKGPLLWIRAGRETSGVVFVLRKSLGTAVVRNRLKRRLRNICRDLRLPDCSSLVVFAQPPAVSSTFDRLRDELTGLLTTPDDVRDP